MPTQTFQHLEKERRERFIEVAFDEFLQHNYEAASVTQIVKRLGIGKGSAYRYFENKRELYFYLKSLAEQAKMAYVQPLLDAVGTDFFEMYRSLFKAGLRFMREQPRYSHFLYNVSQERNSAEL
ncbi:MAG: TetR/AcrR family transcriptional regulator, partial [Bacteroidota bacterium]